VGEPAHLVLLFGGQGPRSTTEPTSRAGSSQSVACPLGKNVAFHLGERRHHGQDEPPRGGGGVDAQGEDAERDPSLVQVLDQAE
jgi:hypothetical protein